VAETKQPGAALHLLGLCSDGGVHSHINHLYALLRMAKDEGVEHVFIHALTDGRDTPPRVGKKFLRAIEKRCKALGVGEIATVSGRYYGMDRDNRWERERQAYDSLANDVGPRFSSAEEAVDAAYKRGEGDEFITPSIIETRDHRTSKIINGDSVVFFNFRQDRARQLSHGFTDAHFEKFHRERLRIRFTTFTSYDKSLNLPVAFPPENVKNTLGEWLAKKRIKQFHTAETEKYAHVTYFFNGGREKPFRGEDRGLFPSPKVTTYDLQPEMSAYEIRDGLLKAMRSGLYGFLVVNFANADMVGHTGKLDATVKAVEVIDECLSALETEAETNGYVMLVTADHGNAEDMTGRYKTSHTLNEVPFFVVDPSKRFVVNRSVRQPKLADVATTVLRVMGVPFAPEMTGNVLVKEK
ncbi:2,3-bisphosphoglycerate-independent phosphoglycerate mutase, partial [Candidatus Woesearchaeota archaeon]|nr:2,3-bisphosphoglycerate-independent phosphoglycerate mutase [Candidatus Woesearchaeota archaeon]